VDTTSKAHVECPQCNNADATIIFVMVPPRKHLSTQNDVIWCENCGTIMLYNPAVQKVKKVLTPMSVFGSKRIGGP